MVNFLLSNIIKLSISFQITGDNIETAIAIAKVNATILLFIFIITNLKEAGILPSEYEREPNDYVVMEGNEFEIAVGGLVKQNEQSLNEEGKSESKEVDKVKNMDIMEVYY